MFRFLKSIRCLNAFFRKEKSRRTKGRVSPKCLISMGYKGKGKGKHFPAMSGQFVPNEYFKWSPPVEKPRTKRQG